MFSSKKDFMESIVIDQKVSAGFIDGILKTNETDQYGITGFSNPNEIFLLQFNLICSNLKEDVEMSKNSSMIEKATTRFRCDIMRLVYGVNKKLEDISKKKKFQVIFKTTSLPKKHLTECIKSYFPKPTRVSILQISKFVCYVCTIFSMFKNSGNPDFHLLYYYQLQIQMQCGLRLFASSKILISEFLESEVDVTLMDLTWALGLMHSEEGFYHDDEIVE